MKPEAILSISCRGCGRGQDYVVCDSDAIAVEASLLDNEPMICFQAFDVTGLVRTIVMQSADIRQAIRTPLQPKERTDIERKMRGEKPLPKLTLKGIK
jgi:hypothetical protein